MKKHNRVCPLCGGTKKRGKTIFSLEAGSGVVVVRDVPARICGQCGEEWIDSKTAVKIEHLINRTRRKSTDVEVLSFAA